MPPDIATIREAFPVTAHMAYLNTGSVGPLARRVYQVLREQTEIQVRNGRADLRVILGTYMPLREKLRARFARLLGASSEEITLTHHTTEGMNIAIWGLPWQPGDEIVTTSLEHAGGLLPVYAAARRFNLTLRVVDLGLGDVDVVDRIATVLTPRTRLVVLSHVTYTTGAVLPVKEIATAAHAVGAMVAVDGAQSVGAIPVDMQDLDVDFYAVPGQKWLCGPEGVGALYVRRERLSELGTTFMGYASLRDPEARDLSGHFIPAPGAARYETGTVFWPGFYAMEEVLRWFEDELGYDWICERTREITKLCREMLAEVPMVTVITPPEQAGLTSFQVARLDPEAAVQRLAEQDVVIRWMRDPLCLRASTGFFNNEDDLLRLRDGLLALPQNGR